MDDSWLDTTLKVAFMTSFENPFDVSQNCNNVKWHRLNELISAKKSYTSIVKRASDFIDFDTCLYNKLQNDTETISKVISLCTKLNGTFGTSDEKNVIPSEILNLFEFIKTNDHSIFFIEREEFFCNYIYKKIGNFFGNTKLFENTKTYIEKNIIDECDVLDCIIGEIKYGTGLSENTPVFVCNKTKKSDSIEYEFIHLNKISNLKHQLDIKRSEEPFFHVYICPKYNTDNRTIKQFDRQKIIEQIASQVAESLSRYILEELEKINISIEN